jgi:nicotinamidase-related amidase
LLEHLRDQGVDHVVVCGMMTHMCVASTVRAAFDYGLEITVVHEACATGLLPFKIKPFLPRRSRRHFCLP